MPAKLLKPDEAHLRALIPAELGPAMQALNERQRIFVVALLDQGTKHNQSAAARKAGYRGKPETIRVMGHQLAHYPKVQAAILEEAKKRLQLGTGAAAALLLETIGDKKVGRHDRLRAAESVLDRGGLHARTEHTVTVTKDRTEKLRDICRLAREFGLDPRQVVGDLADVLEGDFKVLKEIEGAGETAGIAAGEAKRLEHSGG